MFLVLFPVALLCGLADLKVLNTYSCILDILLKLFMHLKHPKLEDVPLSVTCVILLVVDHLSLFSNKSLLCPLCYFTM